MATTPTPNLDTMPMGDLRQLASQPEAAPVLETPAVPVVPSPYEFKSNDDGTWYAKLDTGEEFKGKPEEFAQTLLKSKHDSSSYAKSLKAQIDAAAPAATPQAEAVATQQLNNDLAKGVDPQVAAQKYFETLSNNPIEANAWAMAQFLGFDDPAEMKAQLSGLVQMKQANESGRIAAQFVQLAPDFPHADPKAIAALDQHMEKNGIPFTPDNLVAAHLLLVKRNAYSPTQLQAPTPQTNGNTPPPMLTGGAPQAGGAPDPWKMDMNELRQQAMNR